MKEIWLNNLLEPVSPFKGRIGSFFVCMAILLCGLVAPVGAEDNPARQAANDFLELLDAGSYQQAWWEGSEYLHATSDLDQWVKEVETRRGLFGRFEERSIKSTASRTSFSGFPDGQYEILLYDSRFQNKRRGLEMLILGRDLYGAWRVVSYRLR